MAIMINCAQDWTFDLFMEDAQAYKATPIKGVYCGRNESDRKRFMVWLKNHVRDFKDEWFKEHEFVIDDRNVYIGDAFAEELWEGLFSDLYKDTYGQRPHLDTWFYVQALGLPTSQDVTRKFCATPVEDAIERAKEARSFE